MSAHVITIRAAFDPEVRVWFVESSTLEGLNVEGSTLEVFCANAKAAILDLLDEDDFNSDCEVPIDLIAHAEFKVRAEAA